MDAHLIDSIPSGMTLSADCIVFVRSPDGEQEFELAAGESVTVTGITEPIKVSAVAAAS